VTAIGKETFPTMHSTGTIVMDKWVVPRGHQEPGPQLLDKVVSGAMLGLIILIPSTSPVLTFLNYSYHISSCLLMSQIVTPTTPSTVPCLLRYRASTVPCLQRYRAFYGAVPSTVPCLQRYRAYNGTVPSTVPCFYGTVTSLMPLLRPWQAARSAQPC
jgi:hypothetical protein